MDFANFLFDLGSPLGWGDKFDGNYKK